MKTAVTLAIPLMTSPRTRLSLGPAAWFGALLIGILLALAVPALAAGAETTDGSTAVADPPAQQLARPPAPPTRLPATDPAPAATDPAPAATDPAPAATDPAPAATDPTPPPTATESRRP